MAHPFTHRGKSVHQFERYLTIEQIHLRVHPPRAAADASSQGGILLGS